jgi:hypothetical protein
VNKHITKGFCITVSGDTLTASNQSLLQQLRRNSVALISIVIAVSSLSYNTWRNEKTEDNRNLRFAAFEVLLKLGELQQVVFHHHYDGDSSGSGNPRTGWTYVLTIRDLARISGSEMSAEADNLYRTWKDNWQYLGSDQDKADTIITAIEHMRDTAVSIITSLE